ncbi:hypothetical protein BDW72DRAFT_188187, partial [Aspergillus terricola var. indicus]
INLSTKMWPNSRISCFLLYITRPSQAVSILSRLVSRISSSSKPVPTIMAFRTSFRLRDTFIPSIKGIVRHAKSW